MVESTVNNLLNYFPTYQAFEETRDLLFNKIAQALQDRRIRVVLTDHDYSRESMKKGGDGIHRQASLYMLEKYDRLFASAYQYGLPASYQTDKARLFLRRDLKVADPRLQSEIIAATSAEHKLLKLAITSEVLKALQSTESEEHRLRILQRAIEPFRAKF